MLTRPRRGRCPTCGHRLTRGICSNGQCTGTPLDQQPAIEGLTAIVSPGNAGGFFARPGPNDQARIIIHNEGNP